MTFRNYNNESLVIGSGTASTLSYPMTTYSYILDNSGTEVGLKTDTKKGIHPRLYFKYVKSKLSKTDLAKLKPRMLKLKVLADEALEVGQKAVYEHILQQVAILARTQTVAVAGYDLFVTRGIVNKFKNVVQDRIVEFCTLEEFPRVLPKGVQQRLRSVQNKQLFDNYYVLHTNLSKEKKAETQQEKIIKKDPILFGAFAYDTDRLFYITDWVDEYCDLTLDKFTETINNHTDKEWRPQAVKDLSDKEIREILQEVSDRHGRLQSASKANFRDLAAVEASSHKKEKPWWRFW